MTKKIMATKKQIQSIEKQISELDDAIAKAKVWLYLTPNSVNIMKDGTMTKRRLKHSDGISTVKVRNWDGGDW